MYEGVVDKLFPLPPPPPPQTTMLSHICIHICVCGCIYMYICRQLTLFHKCYRGVTHHTCSRRRIELNLTFLDRRHPLLSHLCSVSLSKRIHPTVYFGARCIVAERSQAIILFHRLQTAKLINLQLAKENPHKHSWPCPI